MFFTHDTKIPLKESLRFWVEATPRAKKISLDREGQLNVADDSPTQLIILKEERELMNHEEHKLDSKKEGGKRWSSLPLISLPFS